MTPASEPDPQLPAEFLRRLRRETRGGVLADPVSRGIYATDASFYQMIPHAVVTPRDRADALKAVRLCGEFRVPILPRGGGTSLSGQTIARALVIDVSKHLNRLLEVNIAERWARVEPGLVRDELNAQLKPHGLHFAPDPATSDRANVGGMIGNNSAGMRSIKYGMTIDHVLELDLALSGGEVLNLGACDAEQYQKKCALPDREGEIYRGFKKIIEGNRGEIERRYPKVPRRSCGYLLDAFKGPLPWNMAKLVCSSEGTLGLILEAKVRLEPLPKKTGLMIAQFAALRECLTAVAPIVAHRPSAVEMLDGLVLRMARENRLTRDSCYFIAGAPEAILLVEVCGESDAENQAALERIADDLRGRNLGYAFPLMRTDAEKADAWLMRANGLGLMSTVPGALKPLPFIEDAAVPLEVLPEYIERVLALCAAHERPVTMYAHASVGLLHVRPMLDLRATGEYEVLKSIQRGAFELTREYGGAFSGEHGDGIVRGHLIRDFFGDALYAAFRELKRLFDPLNLMNPNKIVDAPPPDTHLRFMPGYRSRIGAVMFHYREDEGIAGAIEKCNGVGSCRKTLGGVMCPSYIATRDEAHSTRGRANALRLALSGQLGIVGLADAGLHEALELCLSCKACKKECPNSVDLARLKSEALFARRQKEGAALRERIFAAPARAAALICGAGATGAQFANFALAGAPAKWLLERIGIDRRRALPRYAAQRFSDWWARRAQPAHSASARRVALFVDTYLEYFEPQLGRAAVRVLEAAGFAVEPLLRAGCCQRAAISKGFLDQAKIEGERTMAKLARVVERGLPILVCEPSCASALTDDLPDLIDDEKTGAAVASMTALLDEFLAAEFRDGRIELPFETNPAGANVHFLVHGHCHQKSLFNAAAGPQLLQRIPGATAQLIEAGCCGMAGSFGYETEHYELSLKIGADRLFPALRSAPQGAQIAANGFSCRHQIADALNLSARHVIEILAESVQS